MSASAKAAADIRKARVTGFADLPDPKWVRTQKIFYEDPLGRKRDWEACSRQTRIPGAEADGVGIIAILRKPEGPEILLQKQFRPPVEGVCIEVPAGLLDPNETLETCAERELHEETGYFGKAVATSALMYNDPGFCNTNMKMVRIEIDLEDPRNKDPQPQLEDNEFIQTFSIPLADFPEKLRGLVCEGYILDARVENLAAGIELARQFHL